MPVTSEITLDTLCHPCVYGRWSSPTLRRDYAHVYNVLGRAKGLRDQLVYGGIHATLQLIPVRDVSERQLVSREDPERVHRGQ